MANSISSYILLYFFGNALIYFCDVTIICLSALLCFQGIWNYFITLLPKEKKKTLQTLHFPIIIGQKSVYLWKMDQSFPVLIIGHSHPSA